MLMGVKFKANPTEQQKLSLSQWMGCARTIWNAKCEEDTYLRTFARKYLPIRTYPKVDQVYSDYKNKELTPWLFKCPSQLLRNSATNWYATYGKFLKGVCGRPRRKKKTDEGSIHITNELFSWKKNSGGSYQLFIGSKNNNIGFLSIKTHKKVQEPKSIYIKKKNGVYSVSFCYQDDVNETLLLTGEKQLKRLRKKSISELEMITDGVDRGVKVMAQAVSETYDYSDSAKQRLISLEFKRKRYQRWMARQALTSNRRKRTKKRIAKTFVQQAHIRNDFCHKTSRKIVGQESIEVIVMENLKTKNMTGKAKAKQDEQGRWLKNGAKAKSGLNKAILSKGWHKLEAYTMYKAQRENKVVFKVSPHYTSQECADCGHIHPENRVTRDDFVCQICGHAEDADSNAAKVIKKRAINLIKHSGTELSKTGVLTNPDIGHGDTGKSLEGKPTKARIKKPSNRKELSKKKELVVCV
ncbi:transposase [bacterium]|nr:transposase [bacterium]